MADRITGGERGREDRLTDRIGLGVLTRLVHRDLVDEVLADTGRTERRRRLLPARVVVYFVLAMTLFFDDAYEEVMRKLVDGLRFLRSWDEDWQVPSASALCQARARLGAEPVRELYARVARPLADAGTSGAWLADVRVMAIDGVQLDVADTADNEDAFGRGVSQGLDAPYPKVKVLGLGECGTHAVIDAHLGEVLVDERELARPLLASIDPGMLVLADRGFYSRAFWDEATATGAQLLWRVQSSLKLRYYSWAWISLLAEDDIDTGWHYLLIRRNDATGEHAYLHCYSPRPATLHALVAVAGQRWRIEESFQGAKGLTGLDQHQVRRWRSWHRWTTLAMLAHAFLAVATATERHSRPTPTGLIMLTVNEFRRLFDALLLTTRHTITSLLAWSRWRRQHQYRARQSHYRRRENQ